MIFRFDDVCYNADMELHLKMTEFLQGKFDGCIVMWAISPLVSRSEYKTQRVFPQEWNALSDYRRFYNTNYAEVPEVPDSVKKASHGLIHIDHRLLDYHAQEMSILVSCSLTGAKTFVPPFNKWNENTEKICTDNGIHLVKFEQGWKSMEYNSFTLNPFYISNPPKWYLHARCWSLESFKEWFSE